MPGNKIMRAILSRNARNAGISWLGMVEASAKGTVMGCG
jgi:hypothetical protein